jgi:hypothetical protein
VPVLHNARWSLPAGRYRIEVTSAAGGTVPPDAHLGLQLGRLGGPALHWPVRVDARRRWSQEFDLPIHVGSVGFRADPGLAALNPALVLRPLSVRDAGQQPPVRQVLQAARYGDLWVFFHDDDTYPEGGGFWTPAGRRLNITVTAAESRQARLNLRAGPVATAVRVAMPDGAQHVSLAPHEERLVTLPPGRGVWPITLDASAGFVPADHDPSSQDRRQLACWVSMTDE